MQTYSSIARSAILLLLAAAPHAQLSGDASGVEGTVINSATDGPVPRALVVLQETQPRFTLTDQGGHFRFPGPVSRDFYISVTKRGFVSDEVNTSAEMDRHAYVRGGPNVRSVAIRLVPTGSIHGRITADDGSAIEGAQVKAFIFGPMNGAVVLREQRDTKTDDYGEFAFYDLVAARYFISAGPGQISEEPITVEHSHIPPRGYPQLFFPGVGDPHAATPIDLGPGQDADANLTLPEVPLYSVTGHVSIAGPDKLNGLMVTADNGTHYSFDPNFDEETGRFKVSGLPAGSYRIIGHIGPDRSLEQQFSVESDIPDMDLVLPSARGIRVTAHAADHGAEKGSVSFYFAAEDIWAQSVSASLRFGPGVPETYVQEPSPGKYRAHFYTMPPLHVVSAMCGGIDLLREPLVTDARGDLAIDITLASDSATLSGRVMGMAQIRSAQVLLSPIEPPAELQLLNTDSAGNFTRIVAPGSYRVWAFDHLPRRYREADGLQSYASKAQSLTLNTNQQREIILELLTIDSKQ